MADSFLPGSISDSDNEIMEVKDHVNQVEDHVDHVDRIDQVAVKVWGEEPAEAEEKNKFNKLGARPRPKLIIENGTEMDSLPVLNFYRHMRL